MKHYICSFLLLCLFYTILIADAASINKLPRKTYRVLQEVQTLTNNTEATFQEVNASISRVAHRLQRGSKIERSYIHNMYGIAYLMNENLYDRAIYHFNQVLLLDALEQSLLQNTRYELAAIYLEQQSYAKAIALLKAWSSHNEKPSYHIAIAIANAYIALKQYNEALPYAQKALSLHYSIEHLEILFIIHYSLKDYDRAIDDLYALLRLNPYFGKYYHTMASLLLEKGRKEEAIAILETGYWLEVLDEPLIIRLSMLIYEEKAPYRAAKMVQKAMDAELLIPTKDHYRLLESYLMEAKAFDEAIKVIESALKAFDDDKMRHRLVSIYYQNEYYDKSIALAKKMLKTIKPKGSNIEPYNDLQLLLSKNYYEKKAYNKAINHLKQVKKPNNTKPNSKVLQQYKKAKEWIRYIKRID